MSDHRYNLLDSALNGEQEVFAQYLADHKQVDAMLTLACLAVVANRGARPRDDLLLWSVNLSASQISAVLADADEIARHRTDDPATDARWNLAAAACCAAVLELLLFLGELRRRLDDREVDPLDLN